MAGLEWKSTGSLRVDTISTRLGSWVSGEDFSLEELDAKIFTHQDRECWENAKLGQACSWVWFLTCLSRGPWGSHLTPLSLGILVRIK